MQQINLYLPEFQPNREPLRTPQMLLISIVGVVCLLAISFYSLQQNKSALIQLQKKQEELSRLKNQITDLNQKIPKNNLEELDKSILNLRKVLEKKELTLSTISNKNMGNNQGFSEHLIALGRQSLSTFSLNVFSLKQGGNYLEFAGVTQSADQIPLYIQRLRSESVFSQAGFGVLNITSIQNQQGLFEFSLAKNIEQEKDDDKKTAVQMLLDLNKEAVDRKNQRVGSN
jgi:Tfp pilus assembly protein PilN